MKNTIESSSVEINAESILEVTTSPHNMPCVQVENPSPELRKVIRQAMTSNRLGEEAYKLAFGAGAFLQADSDDYILVEFWKKEEDYLKFVDYLNRQISSKK